jgi:hypothetical protein
MKGYCIVCGKEIEVKMCCSGYDCGCMGQPTEPPVCSDVCYDELMNNLEKYYPTNNTPTGIDIDFLVEIN